LHAKMLGVVMASVPKHLEFSDFSKMKLYNDSLAGESRDHHVSGVTIAYEASRAVWTPPGALDNCLGLRDLCMLTWVPMSRLLRSNGPGIYLSMCNDLIDEPFLVGGGPKVIE
jgi:hypothetical protein